VVVCVAVAELRAWALLFTVPLSLVVVVVVAVRDGVVADVERV
jgi:hypothetical protein